MKKLIGNLILLAVIVTAISFFAAPMVAFFAIRSAAQADDISGLSRLIDFDAVRASLRPQLSGRPEAMTPPPSFIQDPIGAVQRQFDRSIAPAGPDVDGYLSPDAIDALTLGEGRLAAERTDPAAAEPPVSATGAPFPHPTYWGVNRARMAIVDQGGSRTIFTFERKGPFEWKLVHIGLPDGGPPKVARNAPVASR